MKQENFESDLQSTYRAINTELNPEIKTKVNEA